jgi:hypothetical protein
VFVSRVLRIVFASKWEKLAGGWRRLHNDEIHKLYASPNIVKVNKPRMRWAGHVA